MSLSLSEVSKILDVPKATLTQWIASRHIPFQKVGGEYCFFPHELRRWATANGRDIDTALTASENMDEQNSLQNSVMRGGLFFQIPGQTAEDVIKSMTASIDLPGEIDKAKILEWVLERERMASTAIGESIAVPHMRAPLASLKKACVALAILPAPILWGETTRSNVRIVFLPCCPNMRNHLNILMKIAYLGKNKQLLEQLTSGTSPEVVMELLAEADAAYKQ